MRLDSPFCWVHGLYIFGGELHNMQRKVLEKYVECLAYDMLMLR